MTRPKLRFKEFDGDWNSIAIGKFLKIKSGLGFKAEEYTTDEEIRLLQIENVGYGKVKWTHNVKFVPSNYLEVHKDLVLRDGDLVLALNRPVTNDQLKIAKLTKQDSPSILYQRVGKLDLLKEDFDTDFIFQIFQKDVKSYVLNSSIGSDQPFISTTDLYKHKLCIPPKGEQIKIASFLSSVDGKISQLNQKHELLSQYKQGMMQKLFSQQIRFKADDGSEFGEWEEIALGEIKGVSIASGKSSYEKLESAKYYYYGSTGVIGYSNEYDYQGTKILIARVGHNAGYIYMVTGKYNVSDNTLILELPSNLNYIFIRAFLEKIQLNKLVFGTGQPLITGGLLKKVVIQVPCLEEQTKIANFLSVIDQKVENVAQQIEETKQWKKGLLQQMFV